MVTNDSSSSEPTNGTWKTKAAKASTTAVWTALKDAISAVGDHKTAVRLDAPATPERVLAAIATLDR